MPRLLSAAAVLAGAALALTACSDDSIVPSPPTPPPAEQPSEGATAATTESAAPVPDGLAEYHTQDVTWAECGEFECADVAVPLDYDDPAGEQIEIAVKRRPADGPESEVIGSLVLNPGGPGGSGVDFVEHAGNLVSPEIAESYHLVGFDPRGVGESAPVDCVSDDELDEMVSADYPETPAGEEAWAEDAAAFGQGCAEHSGALAGNIDTVSAARDMDILRAVLGDENLNYLGYSYGTYLGATYAELFPQNVGRMVLDGAVDPTRSSVESSLFQVAGFEDALRAYVEDCQAGPMCPLTGTVDDGMSQVVDLVESASENPIPTDDPDRPLTGSLAYIGVIFPLYDDASWPFLTSALTAAIEANDGTLLREFADLYYSRTPDGSYSSNATEAFLVINCLDSPAVEYTDAELAEQEARYLAEAPHLGRLAGGVNDELCLNFPFASEREPAPVTAAGSGPILVIGTTGDPATPYQDAVAVADQLENGHLLTYEGEGHTAYGRSNECVQDAVDGYLLTGTPPEDGLTC